MFTGIVQGRGFIRAAEDHAGGRRLEIELPEEAQGSIEIGASISVAGVCLTVVGIAEPRVHFDVIAETLRLTTLGSLEIGDAVNIERAARFGAGIGGHLLSGHISGVAALTQHLRSPEEVMLRLRVPAALRPYILPKGFIAIDGVSLTIGRVEDNEFTVHLIPETLRRTTLDQVELGGLLNIELDSMTQAVVDTVERVLRERGP